MSTTLPATRSSSAPRLELLKIGSDPEALFVQLPGGVLVPATRFVGTQRALSAWIGTDGYSSTAELRPRPARDVWLHAREIAEALTIVNQVVCQKETDITMVAQPHHASSPCGGHIHASFVLHDPLAAQIIVRGSVWNTLGDGTRSVPASGGVLPLRRDPFGREPSPTSRYVDAARTGAAFGFSHLVNKLHSFIGPLETELHHTERRTLRNYGTGEDALRSEHAAVPLGPGVLRWRVEYRYPSTWLSHPALALAYLGLVKLVVNNYHLPVQGQPPLASLPAYVDEFLGQPEAVVTDDVRPLPKILRFVLAEVQPRLQEPLVRVDFEAWTRFLKEGRWK